jgi:hypothetical protein
MDIEIAVALLYKGATLLGRPVPEFGAELNVQKLALFLHCIDDVLSEGTGLDRLLPHFPT